MNLYILIRNYKPGDELACRQIAYEAVMSTVNVSFFLTLTREITLQLVVIMAAIMFVFLGLPPSICLLAIPITVVTIYLGVYIGHAARAYGMIEDVYNIPRNYMSSQFTGFWVAEAYEPFLMTSDVKKLNYEIIKESEFDEKVQNDNNEYSHKIVGTIAIARSKVDIESAWLRRMAVTKRYQRKGIANALLKEVIEFCTEKGYENIDLITTEYHDTAREIYLKKGFELKQLYHKQIIGNIFQVLMYELTYKLPKTTKASDDKCLLNKSFVVTK